MDKVINFLKNPFEFMGWANEAMFVFLIAGVLALVFLIVLFGVVGTKSKIKKNKKILMETQATVNAQHQIISSLTGTVSELKSVVSELKLQINNLSNTNTRMVNEVKDVVDIGNKQMAAIIFESFPTKEEKSKAQLFDKLGGMFANATVNPERLDKVITNYNLDKTSRED